MANKDVLTRVSVVDTGEYIDIGKDCRQRGNGKPGAPENKIKKDGKELRIKRFVIRTVFPFRGR